MALNHTSSPANGSALWRRGSGETSKGQTDLTSLCQTHSFVPLPDTLFLCLFLSNYSDHNQVLSILLSTKNISSSVSSVSCVEDSLQGLLEFLTSSRCSPTQHLEQEQALARQFAEILHFTLRFDELKMTNPAIQNDFSYYRRTLSRMRIINQTAEEHNEVDNELANRMSLFYANATPMLKTLSDATTKFVSKHAELPVENTTDCLSTMASVCKVMLETPEYRTRFASDDTVLFCLRVMVGVIILYDYVHPAGAFVKSSKIDMKGCIKVLRYQPPNSVEGLLNALRSVSFTGLLQNNTYSIDYTLQHYLILTQIHMTCVVCFQCI
uniref:Family with sequence similarity 49 member Ba n=1 Tax=Cyprinus carpio carpio TaxID=630221 RepID=A0A9J8BJ81_CYPCA